MYFPTPENQFLNDVVLSIKRRRKALKHKNVSVVCERLVEDDGGKIREKIELEFLKIRGVSIRIFLWSDRLIWIDSRAHCRNGWIWDWSCEGRVLGSLSGREIVKSVEDMLDLSSTMSTENLGNFAKIWEGKLARGLRLIGK